MANIPITRHFEISSADGWDLIEFQVEVGKEGMDEAIACISGRGKFWDRTIPSGSSVLVDDFSIAFHQTRLSRKKLAALRAALSVWMSDSSPVSLQLTENELPRITVALGPVEGIICSPEKPVFVLTYSDSRIETLVKFVVDQSCIRLFLDGLSQALA